MEQRLNKFLSACGVGSRRKCETFIIEGRITVNNVIVKELATKITDNDIVKFDDEVIMHEKKTYVLLNKPEGVVTTLNDPEGRKTVGEYFKKLPYIKPVGRLDMFSSGVLLLTNDGDLLYKLTHPKFQIPKVYKVTLNRKVDDSISEKIKKGVRLDDGKIAKGEVLKIMSRNGRTEVILELREGINREIRRIFEILGFRVLKLDRTKFAGLGKGNLKEGEWRHLDSSEIEYLQNLLNQS